MNEPRLNVRKIFFYSWALMISIVLLGIFRGIEEVEFLRYVHLAIAIIFLTGQGLVYRYTHRLYRQEGGDSQQTAYKQFRRSYIILALISLALSIDNLFNLKIDLLDRQLLIPQLFYLGAYGAQTLTVNRLIETTMPETLPFVYDYDAMNNL